MHLRDSKDVREKKMITSLFMMLAKCADKGHLSQLICESTDHNVATVQILRKTHGMFATQKDTGRYKRYINELNRLDTQSNPSMSQK
jgi:hypothetical protein